MITEGPQSGPRDRGPDDSSTECRPVLPLRCPPLSPSSLSTNPEGISDNNTQSDGDGRDQETLTMSPPWVPTPLLLQNS